MRSGPPRVSGPGLDPVALGLVSVPLGSIPREHVEAIYVQMEALLRPRLEEVSESLTMESQFAMLNRLRGRQDALNLLRQRLQL